MLKLKLQYFGHLMWRTDSLEKTLMLGKIEGRRRRGRQRIRWLDGIIDSVDMSLSKLWMMVKGREACCQWTGVAKSWTRLREWTELTEYNSSKDWQFLSVFWVSTRRFSYLELLKLFLLNTNSLEMPPALPQALHSRDVNLLLNCTIFALRLCSGHGGIWMKSPESVCRPTLWLCWSLDYQGSSHEWQFADFVSA